MDPNVSDNALSAGFEDFAAVQIHIYEFFIA
jgi:hypothetical protein